MYIKTQRGFLKAVENFSIAIRWFLSIIFVIGIFGCGGKQLQTLAKPGISAAQHGFEIRMHRPSIVGERCRFLASGKKYENFKMRANEDVQEERKEIVVEFEGVGRVVSMDEKGRVIQSEFTIERFETLDNGSLKPLLSKGDILMVVRARGNQTSKDAQITVNGHEISTAIREAIEVIFPTHISTEATDDDVFGTTQKQIPGAQWPIHADIAERDFANNLGIESKLSGSTKFIQKTTFQGTDCLELSSKIDGTVTRIPDKPFGAIFHGGTITATSRGIFPTDLSMPILSSNEDINIHAIMSLGSKELEANIVVKKQITYTPI
jgi:hypothetical protein